MVSMIVRACFLVLATILEASAEDTPTIYKQFHAAFGKENFTKEEINKILLQYYREGIDTKSWPFTDCGKELALSINNKFNSDEQKDKIKQEITNAGGDADHPENISKEVCGRVHIALDHGASGPSSMLQTESSDPGTLMYLSRSLGMTSGSVASNSAAIKSLESTVATNIVNINELSTTVMAMSDVTQPTMVLAEALGLPVQTVSSMALAGSFIGPLMGVCAIVYASWPQEEVDPWLQVESRVSHMISESFDNKRRKRLGDRLRRYVKQFSRCSQAWVADGLVNVHGVSVPRHILDEARLMKGQGGDFEVQTSKTHERFPAPPCTAQLEGHMSLERDEWFKTENGQMSGLFMGFANMHTQVLSLLSDHPYDDKMQWDSSLRTTSAEYASYMLNHLVKAWKAQACRTLRLRQSMKNLKWRYQMVVLKEVHQPHASQRCDSKCRTGGEGKNDTVKTGWCPWCGGTHVGACCKKGDTGVCSRFDTENGGNGLTVGWYGEENYYCVHTDCIQRKTGYYGNELKRFGLRENGALRSVEECQQLCQTVREGTTAAKYFTLSGNGKKCTCNGPAAKRHEDSGAHSGPVECKQAANSIKQFEEELEDSLNETLKVPMEEYEACAEENGGPGKSATVSDFKEVEKDQEHWVKECMALSARVATAEYNKFYEKFAKFVDTLAWKAGCGTTHEVSWGYTAKDGNGMEAVSERFDAGFFSECNWDRENEKDSNMNVWKPDEEGKRGITGTSKNAIEEQKAMKTGYPMPSWLNDLKKVQGCLTSTAAGSEKPNNGAGSAIEEATGPGDWSADVREDGEDPEYEDLLNDYLRDAMSR